MNRNRRIKVLHFTGSSLRSPYLCAIADHVDRSQFDITVASLCPPGDLQKDIGARGLQTFALKCTGRLDKVRAIIRLAIHLRRQRYDVIQTHLFDASVVGLTAGWLAGTPLRVLTGHHSHEIPLHRRKALLWVDRLCSYWLSHHIIAPSVQMKEIFVEHENVPPERITVIPYGFDLKRWEPPAGAKERIRAELGLDGKLVFCIISRMFWVKNYPSLFKAFADIAAKIPEAVLLAVGDGSERENLKRLVRELSIEDRVIFAGQRTDVVDVLDAVDVLVHPSLAESFGQVVVEAFALRKPVVSTKVGIAPEIIEDGINGFLAPNSDPVSLRETLEKMLAARNRWAEMGTDGQKRVQRFSVEKIEPAYEAKYKEWLTETGSTNGKER